MGWNRTLVSRADHPCVRPIINIHSLNYMKTRPPIVPIAPKSIQKGVPLKLLIDENAIECLALNIQYVKTDFDVKEFCKLAHDNIESLSLMQRGKHVAKALHQYLPNKYSDAIQILVSSFTPSDCVAEDFGLAGFFYLPHGFFISEYGLNAKFNDGEDPYDESMQAMYELTTRFTAEFAIRDFLITQQERTLSRLSEWVSDPNPHIRRLCSEGTRPKLPWGKRIKSFVLDPTPAMPMLDALKNDSSLYVRRSVANHLGDIAKDHPELVFKTCDEWLKQGASAELKWLIRHAVRYLAKKSDARALKIREQAKA